MATTINAKTHVLKLGVHRMTSPFGMRKRPYAPYDQQMHNGIDFTGKGGSTDFIIAFEDGIVTYARDSVAGKTSASVTPAGNYVVIEHVNGYQTRYCHMKHKSVVVKKGDIIKKGDVIGYMGTTGSSTGNHLHFGMQVNDTYIDPMPYLLGEKAIKPKPEKLEQGDINGDGTIDDMDTFLAKRTWLGNYAPTQQEFERGDMDNDGDIDAMDWLRIKLKFSRKQ